MENEKPGLRLSQRPRGVEKPGGESGELSPETVELLRGAEIPAEFLTVAQEFVPRTDRLRPIAGEALATAADLEASLKEPMLEMPVEPGLASDTESTSAETAWKDVPWTEPRMLPDPPEDVRSDGGAERFYLTDLKLDLGGVSHMTPGLLPWKDVRLEQVVTDTCLVLFDEEDDERAPGEDARGDGEELPPPPCHCQGGRLAIIIGESDDAAIRAALNWAAASSLAHMRSVYFEERRGSSPSLTRPQVSPGAADKRWLQFQEGKQDQAIERLVATYREFCFYDEVVIFAHGGQVSLYNKLAKFLPRFLDRPVKKLVLWICGGGWESFVFTDDDRRKHFEKICHLVRPPLFCPCGCFHARCDARSADGRTTKCPDPDTPTVVLSAGYYRSDGMTVPSKLGLDPARPDQPFTAPDARLIATTVTWDGVNEARIEPRATQNGSVLGIRVRSDDRLKEQKPPKYAGFDPGITIVDKKITNPETALTPDYSSYSGPRVNSEFCPARDGCLR
jgi:hypothetical protein